MSPLRPDLVDCWIFRVVLSARDVPSTEVLLLRRAPGRMAPGTDEDDPMSSHVPRISGGCRKQLLARTLEVAADDALVRGIPLRRRRSRVPWIYVLYHARSTAWTAPRRGRSRRAGR